MLWFSKKDFCQYWNHIRLFFSSEATVRYLCFIGPSSILFLSQLQSCRVDHRPWCEMASSASQPPRGFAGTDGVLLWSFPEPLSPWLSTLMLPRVGQKCLEGSVSGCSRVCSHLSGFSSEVDPKERLSLTKLSKYPSHHPPSPGP